MSVADRIYRQFSGVQNFFSFSVKRKQAVGNLQSSIGTSWPVSQGAGAADHRQQQRNPAARERAESPGFGGRLGYDGKVVKSRSTGRKNRKTGDRGKHETTGKTVQDRRYQVRDPGGLRRNPGVGSRTRTSSSRNRPRYCRHRRRSSFAGTVGACEDVAAWRRLEIKRFERGEPLPLRPRDRRVSAVCPRAGQQHRNANIRPSEQRFRERQRANAFRHPPARLCSLPATAGER